ncbi:3-isopropylmalate dehydratase small subunit [Azospirillum canadense]|uniref:3-isopropylmalate dehydratase small subunit n=1 Tax=Azospirillum canadense TaxID=403962 RepID=UPI0022271B0A|nr:3-isopropylmalate dehydratase small subunit [Azospirillum canadense]MCW2240502.1 3-isopropylmalate/(R)-2-methylmalate dehydratase small subunit [Azospirillum canadense]
MEKFVQITGYAAPMPMNNINTDMITPKQVMKAVSRKGLSWGLFCEYRFDDQGNENPDFVLNKEPWRRASIVVALENWGCGSSREHAPWAMLDFGIRSVIAISFADIHYNNCFKNGILPVALKPDEVARVMKDAEAGKPVTVDLPSQTVRLEDGAAFPFHVDPFRKDCLLNGFDDIALTMLESDKIDAYESAYRKKVPWLFDRRPAGREPAPFR